MIPKIIHQTWKTNKLPNILENIYKYNININNDYEYYMWTDDNSGKNINNFIMKEYPELYKVYSKIELGVQKSDLARLAIMHYYGGIYIDLDILLVKSLNDLLDYNSDKLYFAFEPSEQTKYLWKKDNYICNAFFACSPKNELIDKMLNSVIQVYNEYGDVIFNKFNIFGSDIFKFVLATTQKSELYEIIDTNKIYPINDIKLEALETISDDLYKLKSGNYENSYMVHYWIHSNFEAKSILNTFIYDDNINIHKNIYNFFKTMYPNNRAILTDLNYIEIYN
jgi:hypothetical protein